MNKIYKYFVFFVKFVSCCVVSKACSDIPADVLRWSNSSIWPGDTKPINGDDVTISESILLDESMLDLGNINITTTGMLYFDPTMTLELRVKNIFIYGAMRIGSENCPHFAQLNITLTGTINDHGPEEKVILVQDGGNLEIHGEPKLSWTKINTTLYPLASSGDLIFEHSTFSPSNPSIPFDQWDERSFINGMAAYTIRFDESKNPIIRNFSEYDLVSEGAILAERIEAVQDGELLMLASQKTIRLKDKKSQQDLAFDALETLLFGEVTNTSLLRNVSPSSTYALVYIKEAEDIKYDEKSGERGVDSIARIISKCQHVFEAFTLGASKSALQFDDFRILTYDGLYPIIETIDDVTSWSPGDRVVFASTDYDWTQREERTVVRCTTCANNQFRIDEPLNHIHWGEFMHNAVDMRAEVGVLTRNVVIQGEVQEACVTENGNCDKPEVEERDMFGGHIKTVGDQANVHIEGALLYQLGQQQAKGRYPVHFHFNIQPGLEPYVKDTTIYDSFAHCVILHASNGVLLKNNFCYTHLGHGFILEDGAELNNTIEGNLVIGTKKGTGDLETSEKTNPSSFWITNPNNRVVNNVGAGGDGTGVWSIFPDLPLAPSTSLNLMDRFEARSTMFKEVYNNVGHSNGWFGVIHGSRLGSDRRVTAANSWQPRENPKDPSSTPIPFELQKLTGYKNRRNNVWVEAGMVTLSKVSVSDSLNGVTLTNDGLVDEFTGVLKESVVVGDSHNLGEPGGSPGSRSIPITSRVDEPHSGLTLWKGPTKVRDLWFGGDYENDLYDIGAIAMKRFSPYFISVQTELKNLLFAFNDTKTGMVRAISGLQGVDAGWKSRDGALLAGFTLKYDGDATPLDNVTYVVRPDHLSAAARTCRVRNAWRFALCTTKYGNIKMSSSRPAVFVRDDLPSAQLEFTMSGNVGPQVVLDGSRIYTVHFPSKIPGKLSLKGEGMEVGDVLIVGVCLPRAGGFLLKSNVPVKIKPTDFIRVASLDDLKKSNSDDGRKYYLDDVSGMMFYKFIDTRSKGPDEMNTCKDGECPDLIIDKIKGSKTDADCRERYYGDALNTELPAQRNFDGIIPANGDSEPPAGWGAGSTRPFDNRDPIDGGYGNWSAWSACSKTCDDGTQYRQRKCNNPVPENGGQFCVGNNTEIRPCRVIYCPIDGEFSEWSEWSECAIRSETECQGRSTRTRTCTNPVPQYNGLECVGYTEEIKSCNNCTST